MSVTRNLKSVKESFIKIHGVDAYLKSFKEYVDTLALSASEKFEMYYEVRCQTLAEYKH